MIWLHGLEEYILILSPIVVALHLTQNLMCDRPLLFACRMWKPGQSDNRGHGHEIRGEDCAGLIHEGLWNDFLCEHLISYICEKELVPCKYRFFSFFFHRHQENDGLTLFDIFSLQQDLLDRSSILKGSLQ